MPGANRKREHSSLQLKTNGNNMVNSVKKMGKKIINCIKTEITDSLMTKKIQLAHRTGKKLEERDETNKDLRKRALW